MSHNPPEPTMLDIYDRVGMVVMDENRDFGSKEELVLNSAAFGSSAKLEAHTFTGNQPLLPRKAHARAHEGTRGHDVAGGKARGVKRVHNLPFVRLKSSANRSNAD